MDALDGLGEPPAEPQKLVNMHITLARAFLMNGERKPAQVSVGVAKDMLNNIATMDAVESAELQEIIDGLNRKVDIEKASGAPIGDLNDFAFLKSEKAQAAPAKPVSQKARIAVKPDWY